ncbi:hypothetical protein [Actinophytocola sp. KF-1]
MTRLGAILAFIGFGSALLHFTSIQFKLLYWAEPWQPFLGLGLGALGAVFLLIPMLMNKDHSAEQPQAGYGPPPGGPAPGGPAPQAAFGQQQAFPPPAGYGPPPTSPPGGFPQQPAPAGHGGFAPQPGGYPPPIPQQGPQYGPRPPQGPPQPRGPVQDFGPQGGPPFGPQGR